MDIDDCKVYVGDLSRDVQKPELEQVFARYGDVKDVWIAHNPPGFAFIRFSDSRDARRAIRAMNGKVIAGSKIRCEVAKAAGPKGGGRGGQGGGRANNNGGGGGFGNRLQGRLGPPGGRMRDNSPSRQRNEVNFPRFSPTRRSRSPLVRRSPRRMSPVENIMPPRNWSPLPGARRLLPRRSTSPPPMRMSSPQMFSRRSPLQSASPLQIRRGPPSPGMRRSPYRRTPPQRRRSPSPMHRRSPSPFRRSLSPPPRRPPSPRYPPADLSPGKGTYQMSARPMLDNAGGRSGRNGYDRRSSRSPPLQSSFIDNRSRDYALPPSSGSRREDRRYDDRDWNTDKWSAAGGRDRSRDFPMPPPPPPMPPSPPHVARSSYHAASPRDRSPPRKRSPLPGRFSRSPSPRGRVPPPPVPPRSRGSPARRPMTPPRGAPRSPIAGRPMSPPSRGSSSSRSRSPLQARRTVASPPRAYAHTNRSPPLRPRSPPPMRARSPPGSRSSPQRWGSQEQRPPQPLSSRRSRSPWQGASRGRAASPVSGSRVRY